MYGVHPFHSPPHPPPPNPPSTPSSRISHLGSNPFSLMLLNISLLAYTSAIINLPIRCYNQCPSFSSALCCYDRINQSLLLYAIHSIYSKSGALKGRILSTRESALGPLTLVKMRRIILPSKHSPSVRMLMLTTIQAPFATADRTKVAVITLPAPSTAQARIIIRLNSDGIRRHAGQTGFAENPPFGGDARLAIDPGRANDAHEAVWVIGFEV